MSVPRQIGLILFIAAVATAAYAGYTTYFPAGEAGGVQRAGGRDAHAVTLATIGPRRLERRIEAVGTTMAVRAVEIVPTTSGRVVEIAFVPGQRVEAGDVLVRLDDDIERADLVEAEGKLDEAELALGRARTLSESNTISQATLEQLTAARTTARAALDRALRRFTDRTVIAPFSGIVGLRRVEVGARIDDNTVIATLDDLTEVEIEFAVPETVFGQIKPGLDVHADGVAFPGRVFEGRVASIDSRIDPASRSFKVRALVPNEDLALPAGMFLHLAVVLDAREALMIPEESVTVQAGEAFVYVASDGKAERRTVSLGQRDIGSVEVTEGLAEGETIVVRGIQALRDGAPIRDVEGAAPAAASAGAPAERGT